MFWTTFPVRVLYSIRLPLHLDERMMDPKGKGRLEGSLSVEMAMLFPVCFLILILLMQTAIGMVWKIRMEVYAEQAVDVCTAMRQNGYSHQEAISIADDFLSDKVQGLPGLEADWNWNSEEGFLTEAFSLSVEVQTVVGMTGNWQILVEEDYIDPVLFRNRVDMVLEIIKGWKDD